MAFKYNHSVLQLYLHFQSMSVCMEDTEKFPVGPDLPAPALYEKKIETVVYKQGLPTKANYFHNIAVFTKEG